MGDRIIFPITPQSWFKFLPQNAICFRIPEECPQPCQEFIDTGFCAHTLREANRRTKRRIEKYNKYKVDLLAMARKIGFELPEFGWSLYFYFPTPKTWSKKKKEAMHGQHKLTKPDIDNLEKAFYDSLSVVDEKVGQLSGHGKFWDKNATDGYIEVILGKPAYNPFGVTFIDQKAYAAQPKRAYKKKKA